MRSVSFNFKRRGSVRRSYAEDVTRRAAQIRKSQHNEAVLLLVLCVILPPLGVFLLWNKGKFSLVVRVVYTAVAFGLMFLFFCLVTPSAKPQIYQPAVSSPAAVTEYSGGTQA